MSAEELGSLGFIKDDIHREVSSESSSDYDEMQEQSLHVNGDGKLISSNLRTDVSKLQRKYISIRKSNKELKQLVLAQSQQMSQIMELLQSSSVHMSSIGTRSNRNTQLSQESSFANAVLNANKASTQIEEEIRQSSQIINSMIGVKDSNANHQHAEPRPTEISDSDNHIETTLRQLDKLSLNEIRRNLPKIDKFDGNPERWLTFERAVMRNWTEGEYADEQMKSHIRQALTGQALARIDSLYLNMSSQRIMDYLKDSFGNSSIVVESARNKLMNLKLAKPLTHASCVEVTTRIANFMAACSYAGISIADSSISSRLHNQLEPYHQELYYKYYYEKHPTATTRMERLDVQFEFLNNLSKTLPLGNFKFEDDKGNKNKSKDYQVMSASVNNSAFKSSFYNHDDYKYEIRDNKIAIYIGYNMEAVRQLPKQCMICARTNHYTIECKTYRNMEADTKYTTVKAKNLCMNCLLTSNHKAKDCDVKAGCGFRIDRYSRCTARHHITLHRSNKDPIDSEESTDSESDATSDEKKSCEKESKEHELSQQEETGSQHEASYISSFISASVHKKQDQIVQDYSDKASTNDVSKPYILFTIEELAVIELEDNNVKSNKESNEIRESNELLEPNESFTSALYIPDVLNENNKLSNTVSNRILHTDKQFEEINNDSTIRMESKQNYEASSSLHSHLIENGNKKVQQLTLERKRMIEIVRIGNNKGRYKEWKIG
ncbi:uncharacterized protein [Chironomus tepperi]|uniref:uncharacterized protein n=1 Tax=Chironomus tepperi TaxID=113505 RepID=UPI00391F2D90